MPGAIVLGMAATTAIGLVVPNGAGGTVTAWPAALMSAPASPAPVLLQLDLSFLTSGPAFFQALPLILTLLLVDMFDNIGTLIGVAKRAGLLDAEGRLPRAGRVLVADSLAAILSALLGTSTVVSYIESASGVEAGGRTGLTTLTTAACFLLALFLTPLFLAVPAAATAPALVVVGIFMMQSASEIDARRLRDGRARGADAAGDSAHLQHRGRHRPRPHRRRGAGRWARATRARMSIVAYVIALVFFLQFFRVFPFGG